MGLHSDFVAYLRRRLIYDPATGELRWRASERAGFAGRLINGLNDQGYIVLRLDGRAYRAQRLIWAMQTGEWLPSDRMVDHRNGKRADNRWNNLRRATRAQNNWNRPLARRDSKTGIKGVKFRPDRQKYMVAFKVNGRLRKFGHFLTLGDAAERAREVEHDLHGEFAPCHC